MSSLTRRFALQGLSAIGVSAIGSTANATQGDPLSVQGLATDQIVGPLSGITIHTSDANAYRRFLQGGMGMTPGPAQTSAQARRFGLDQDTMAMRTYLGPNITPDAIGVRIIEGASPTIAALRPDHDALLPGAMSIGFPVKGIEARAKILAAYDFPAAAGVTDITLPRGDGTTYKVFESHHRAPDGVLCLCIDRADLKPVGPIDTDSLNIGGPAYSGMIVTDAAAMEAMLVGVFGWQKRRDVVLSSSGPNGGLGLPVGQRFIFQQYFAPGTDTGYLVIMQHLMNQRPVPAKLGLSQRGLGMLSFKARRLGDVLARAQARGITILASPNRAAGRSAILATPDGVPMEIIQA
jgi:catechol 2,3-dioxygenase-like lactoylglutathione lyase family enzyme